MSTATDKKYNVILIVVDQWRRDCLGIAGHPDVETPHLDRLAKDGTHFRQAFAATPTCVPARATLMTGLSQENTGFVGYNDGLFWPYKQTVASCFADAGYHTQCIGKIHANPARNLVGFHNVVLHDGYLHRDRNTTKNYACDDDYTPWLKKELNYDADYVDSGLGCNGYVARSWPYPEHTHPTNWVTSQAIDFLRRRDPSKPFFLKMSYHRPHPPLDPPGDLFDYYRDKKLSDPAMGDWAGDTINPGGGDSPFPTDPAQINKARQAYYAQITHIDHQINRMIMELHHHRIKQDTAILFVADHGEMLYDHNLLSKGIPYNASAGIPFILRVPDNHPDAAATKGNTCDKVVEMRDVMPTLLDVAGVDVPENIDGKSVLPLAKGEDVEWRDILHGEHPRGVMSNQFLTDGKKKYIWFTETGREQLFDIENDPNECRDLAPSQPDELATWRQRLIDTIAHREEGFVKDGKLVPGRPYGPVLQYLLDTVKALEK